MNFLVWNFDCSINFYHNTFQSSHIDKYPALAIPCIIKEEKICESVPSINNTFVIEFDHKRNDGVWIVDIKETTVEMKSKKNKWSFKIKNI